MPPDEGHPNEETIEERVFNHDDEAFHVRTDWFLVGHGILFEAFVTARTGDCGSLIALPVWIFGAVAAWAWLGTSVWQVKTLRDVKDRFRGAARAYDEIQRHRRRLTAARGPRMWLPFPWQHGTGVFGYILPIACLVSWLALGVIQWGACVGDFIKAHVCCSVAGSVMALAAWILMACVVKRRSRLPKSAR
jgi:hypothetical protein